MVGFPPLAPSASWMASLLKNFGQGFPMSVAISEANKTISSRDFARFLISDPHDGIMTLSMAVEGGGRLLRNLDRNPGLGLSDHGNWRKTHLGALEACLGKTPFYRFLEPGLAAVYKNPEINSLEDFNSAIFQSLVPFFLGDISPVDISEFHSRPVWKERGKELALTVNPDISSVEVISGLGKEALLAFLTL